MKWFSKTNSREARSEGSSNKRRLVGYLLRRAGLSSRPHAHGLYGASGSPFRPVGRRHVAAMLIIAVLGGGVLLALDPAETDQSRLARVPMMDTTPGGVRQRESEKYRETLRTANVANAEEARRSGNSFVSVPEGLRRLSREPGRLPMAPWSAPENPIVPEASSMEITPDTVEGSKPSIAMPTVRFDESESRSAVTVPVQPYLQAVERSGNPNAAMMLRQMGAISSGMSVPEPVAVEFKLESTRRLARSPNPEFNRATGNSEPIIVPAGTVMRAETVTMLDSDSPSPAVVRLVSGRLSGWTMTGAFESIPNARGMAIGFDTLSSPSGVESAVNAIAIDGSTHGSTVAASFDARLFERYGPMLASSFVSGFADNASRPSVSLAGTASTILGTMERPTFEESLHAGFGETAGKLTSDIASVVPTGPRIALGAGSSIGILFVSTARVHAEPQG